MISATQLMRRRIPTEYPDSPVVFGNIMLYFPAPGSPQYVVYHPTMCERFSLLSLAMECVEWIAEWVDCVATVDDFACTQPDPVR